MTAPENSRITLPAEWEPQDAIVLAWPHQDTDWQPVLAEIQQTYLNVIHHITRFEYVVLFVRSETEYERISPLFVTNQIAVERIIPVFADYNDTWLRDTGPLTIKINDRNQFMDYRFNGWGNKFEYALDNALCEQLFKHPALSENEILKSNIILEGGSIDANGQGSLLTTRQCLLNPNRNPTMSMQDYEKLFESELGINTVHWLTHGEIIGDDTDGHIDMLARFCSPNTIACCVCLDNHDPHYKPLQKMKAELEGLTGPDGKHYQIIELPIPGAIFDQTNRRLPASYCNFLIINKAVLVPVYNDPHDELICDKLAKVFHGREIIPIDAHTIIKQGGSLHCLTMQLPAGTLKLI